MAKKKPATKKTTLITGKTNLKTKSKWMNWKVLVPVVLIIALIGGGFYVYQSRASLRNLNNSFTFIEFPNAVSAQKTVTKQDGTRWAQGSSSSPVLHSVSSQKAKNTARICSVVRVSRDTNVRLALGRGSMKAEVHPRVKANQNTDICIGVPDKLRTSGKGYTVSIKPTQGNISVVNVMGARLMNFNFK